VLNRIQPWLLLLALGCPPLAWSQEVPQAFVGASLIPIAGDEIELGTLVIQHGKIIAAGPFDAVEIPAAAEIHELSGHVIMPGLIDTHTHIGQVAGGDSSAPLHPDVRVLDSINVRHSSIQKAQAGGLTTANLMSGSGHLLSGQTVYLKLKDGRTIEELAIRDAQGTILGGIKMANGTNSQRQPPFPATRARSAALVRERFVKAQDYAEKLRLAGDDEDQRPPRDLGSEALLEVLSGRRVVHHHTHRHDDVLTVLRLSREFGFKVVLHHVSDAWKVADEIAAAGAPCSLIVVDSPGGKLEAADVAWKSGAVLEAAGVEVAFHTDDPITDSRLFLRSAALAVRAGMSRAGALNALTISGARMLELDHRVGTLEAGKDADFVILSGDPLSVYTRPHQTWVEGEKVFDFNDPQDRLYAVGGYGAGDPEIFEGCCLGPLGGER